MEIYILLLIIGLFLAVTERNSNKTVNSFIIILLMLLICGLRDSNIGIDTFRYTEIFKYQLYYDYIADKGEKFFYFTYYIIGSFTDSANLWLFSVSSLIYIPLFFIVLKYSPRPALSALIYMISASLFFPESLNIIRQSIASIFLLIAYCSWNNDNKIKTFIFITIASLFHLTSLLALPYLLLKYVKFNKRVIIISLVAAFLIGLSNFNYPIILVTALENVFSMNNEYIQNITRYARYSELGEITNLVGYLYKVIPLIVLCLITIPNEKNNGKYVFLYNIMFVSTTLYCLLRSIPYSFRIVFGQLIVQILVIPLAYYYSTPKQRLWLIIYIVGLALYYLFYLYRISIIQSPYNNIIPYEFFW